MDKELKKIVNDISEKGWSMVQHYLQGEVLDSAFIFAVWKCLEKKSLWLYYDWRIDKYYFCVWAARKNVPLAKKKSYDVYRVNDYIKNEYGHLIPLAKRISKTLISKGIYKTIKMSTIDSIDQHYDDFMMMISWFTDGKYDEFCAGLKKDGDKPYFIVSDPNIAIKKLKRMGYKTIQTYDEEGNESIEYVLGANFGCLEYDWDEIRSEIEDYIMYALQYEFNDCIWNSSYDEEQKAWRYELDLGDMYYADIKRFVKLWNKRKPYNIKCQIPEHESGEGIGYDLIFKNGFKY